MCSVENVHDQSHRCQSPVLKGPMSCIFPMSPCCNTLDPNDQLMSKLYRSLIVILTVSTTSIVSIISMLIRVSIIGSMSMSSWYKMNNQECVDVTHARMHVRSMRQMERILVSSSLLCFALILPPAPTHDRTHTHTHTRSSKSMISMWYTCPTS